MNKLIHSIQIHVLEKDEDNLQRIYDVFTHIFPIDYDKENILIKNDKLEGLQHTIIHSLTLITTKERHNKILAKMIFSNIDNEMKSLLLNQIESRLDGEGNFYIRFDKHSLFDKHFQLTDSGDCFHIKIKVAGFPAKKPYFIQSIQQIINK